jgi:hypothetical protein
MRLAACCVAAAAAGFGRGPSATAQTATRSLPNAYVGGEPFLVQIAVNPGLPDWTIDEIVPNGWAVDNLADGEFEAGAFDPQGSVIRWTSESPAATTATFGWIWTTTKACSS